MTETTIIWKKCKQCGKLQHPDHLRCLQCKSTTFETVEASGDCTLLTYTILRAPPVEFRKKDQKVTAYALGVVEFTNGIRALGQLTSMEDLKIGMKLQPTLIELTKDLDGQAITAIAYKPLE
jgi:uncharacterized OB-fold protein